MADISPIALTMVGVIIAILLVFILTRKFESAIFWSILLGPALGTSVVNALIQVLSGNTTLDTVTLSHLIFLIAPIDKTFFSIEAGDLVIIGAVILFLWVYVLGHWLTRWKGVWGIPLLPPLIFALGLSLPNFRQRLATLLPSLNFLTEPSMGIGLLALTTGILFLIAYLIWRRGYEVKIPMSQRLKGY